MAVDLSTTYMEIPMKNPIIIGAGPTTATPEICEKAAKVGGWAGVVTKTNYPDEVLRIVPLTVPRPYYAFMDARGVSQWKPVIPKKSGGHDRFGRLGKIQPGQACKPRQRRDVGYLVAIQIQPLQVCKPGKR